jgi:hypothetical protein
VWTSFSRHSPSSKEFSLAKSGKQLWVRGGRISEKEKNTRQRFDFCSYSHLASWPVVIRTPGLEFIPFLIKNVL